ncbi:hypothetical protein HOM50_01150 [bacterium]|jgi:hypothetical protein|nr:hypothetical protein [bacterium]MBT5014997.1 hypothetical protein [bacterium]
MPKLTSKNILPLAALIITMGYSPSLISKERKQSPLERLKAMGTEVKNKVTEGAENAKQAVLDEAADAAIDAIEADPANFAALPVAVRTRMIERHPDRFTQVAVEHPAIMKHFPARKVAKSAASAGAHVALDLVDQGYEALRATLKKNNPKEAPRPECPIEKETEA